jgi:hypothetical protein
MGEVAADLMVEATRWLNALRTPREATERELNVVIGSVAHLAYHLGAIRDQLVVADQSRAGNRVMRKGTPCSGRRAIVKVGPFEELA